MLLNEFLLELKILFKKKNYLYVKKSFLKKNLSNKIAIITGANSGIGFQTAKQLYKQGATVVFACRDLRKAKIAIKNITKNKDERIDLIHLDLESLDSVKQFTDIFRKKYDYLDILINNAGIVGVKKSYTKNGFELQFGVNYIGHFFLTNLLISKLKQSSDARIINLTSIMHDVWHNPPHSSMIGQIFFDDINFEYREFNTYEAYSQSKLALFLFTKHLAKLYQNTNIKTFVVNPGWVRTNSARYQIPFGLYKIFLWFMSATSPWIGSQPILYCILEDKTKIISGDYYSAINIKYKHSDGQLGGWPMTSPSNAANDPVIAEKLWKLSERLVEQSIADNQGA